MRLSDWYAGPLVEVGKLDDISADYIATCRRADPGRGPRVGRTLRPELAESGPGTRRRPRALAIEREGVPNPRKNLRKWADFPGVYGYFLCSSSSWSPTPLTRGSGASTRTWCGPWPTRSPRLHQPPGPDIDWFDQVTGSRPA